MQTVYFPSHDGRTELVGYVFRPTGAGMHPAMVMLHGRAGAYGSHVSAQCALVRRGENSVCGASTLSRRTRMWGEFWAGHGVLALAVDSFGPRGKAHGFARHTHDSPARDRVNEKTVRPLDAEGALEYLQRRRDDVIPMRIAIQGWSNGASTALNVLYRQTLPHRRIGGTSAPSRFSAPPSGFSAALVFYPGCGAAALLNSRRFNVAVPTTVFLAADDEEVSPVACRSVFAEPIADNPRAAIEVLWYDGATHGFDDPGARRQSVAANARARADAIAHAEKLAEQLTAR